MEYPDAPWCWNMFTHIYKNNNDPNADRYSIHGASGIILGTWDVEICFQTFTADDQPLWPCPLRERNVVPHSCGDESRSKRHGTTVFVYMFSTTI